MFHHLSIFLYWMNVSCCCFCTFSPACVKPYLFLLHNSADCNPRSLCFPGLAESHFPGSPLIVYFRMWLFFHFLCLFNLICFSSEIYKGLSSLVSSVPFSLLFLWLWVYSFLHFYALESTQANAWA